MSNEVEKTTAAAGKKPLLEVSHLKKYFKVGKKRTLKAVDDVSFHIMPGETLGVVGESGCGKTTCGRTCVGMYDPTGGTVLYNGIFMSSRALRKRPSPKRYRSFSRTLMPL